MDVEFVKEVAGYGHFAYNRLGQKGSHIAYALMGMDLAFALKRMHSHRMDG